MVRHFLLFSSLSLLINCGAAPTPTTSGTSKAALADHVALLQKNKALWKDANIRDYEFTYQATGGCSDPMPPVVISVKDGAVSSVYVPDFGTYESIGSWPTIDGVFDSLTQAAAKSPLVFAIGSSTPNSPPAFDAKYGFPTKISVDPSDAKCDDSQFTIRDFK